MRNVVSGLIEVHGGSVAVAETELTSPPGGR